MTQVKDGEYYNRINRGYVDFKIQKGKSRMIYNNSKLWIKSLAKIQKACEKSFCIK